MGESLASLCVLLLTAAQRRRRSGERSDPSSELPLPPPPPPAASSQTTWALPAIVRVSCGEQHGLFNSEVRREQAHLVSGLKQYFPFSLLVKKLAFLPYLTIPWALFLT